MKKCKGIYAIEVFTSVREGKTVVVIDKESKVFLDASKLTIADLVEIDKSSSRYDDNAQFVIYEEYEESEED